MSSEEYGPPKFPPRLDWWDVYRGSERAGELLAAFELLQVCWMCRVMQLVLGGIFQAVIGSFVCTVSVFFSLFSFSFCSSRVFCLCFCWLGFEFIPVSFSMSLCLYLFLCVSLFVFFSCVL